MTKLCPLPIAPVPHTLPTLCGLRKSNRPLVGLFSQPVSQSLLKAFTPWGCWEPTYCSSLGSCSPLQPPLHATPKANSEPSPTPCAEGVVHTPIFAQILILNEGSAHLKFASGFPLGKNAARAWTHATHPPCSLNSRSGLFLQPHFGSLYICQPQSTYSCSVPEWTFLSI